MDDATRRDLIARYEDGYRVVSEAVAGLGPDQLDVRPSPEEWTPREIVHHLADSETTSAIRLRRLLVEERPAIDAHDERAYARELRYDRPIEASLALVEAVRRSTAELVDRMTEADWAREGTHSESGRYTAEDWLRTYAAHAHDHAEQIRRAAASRPVG